MSAIQVPLCDADRESIDAMCAQLRSQIENLYSRAYLQGQIDQQIEERDKLQAKLAKVSA